MQTLVDPAILFFVFGVLAGLLRSNLEIPPAISRFLSLYLLMALGLKGGFALAQSGLTPQVAVGLACAVALAVLVPLLGIALGPAAWAWAFDQPLVAPVPLLALVAVVVLSTAQFVVMSGRMIPGMAILASAADPARRGTFMAFNGAVQSAAMGLAALVGGLIISRDDNGLLRHYWVASLLGCAASLASIWVARRLKLHTQQSGPNPLTAQAKAH